MICNITGCKYSICGVCNNMGDFECEHKDYRAIGTVEECRAALEKQIPKKPNLEGDGYDNKGNLIYDTWLCPNCEAHYEVDYDDYNYCPICGQKLDMSDVN